MSMETKHTPLPWKTDPETENESVVDSKGELITDCAIFFAVKGRQNENQANAAFIVEACNNYDRLKANADALEAALRAIVKAERDFWKDAGVRSEMDDPLNEVIKEARAVLKTISKERNP